MPTIPLDQEARVQLAKAIDVEVERALSICRHPGDNTRKAADIIVDTFDLSLNDPRGPVDLEQLSYDRWVYQVAHDASLDDFPIIHLKWAQVFNLVEGRLLRYSEILPERSVEAFQILHNLFVIREQLPADSSNHSMRKIDGETYSGLLYYISEGL